MVPAREGWKLKGSHRHRIVNPVMRELTLITLKWPILSAKYGGKIRPGIEVALCKRKHFCKTIIDRTALLDERNERDRQHLRKPLLYTKAGNKVKGRPKPPP